MTQHSLDESKGSMVRLVFESWSKESLNAKNREAFDVCNRVV